MMDREHKAYRYAQDVCDGKINAPKYVKLQCKEFLRIADEQDNEFCISKKKVKLIDKLLKLMIMPSGMAKNQTVYDSLAGFQFFLIIAVLCTVHRENKNKRKYETALLEICRKNGKTIIIGVIFILLFFCEPKFSKFYSVAPDGTLSREVKTAIREIILSSPALMDRFKIRRDDIKCLLNENVYIPLNYSNSRLDGRLPNAFLADEVGALPNPYAIEAMRSGQLTILNKLGCIISTKYPTFDNPFEDEVQYAKNVLDGVINDSKVFALLYEPDNTKEDEWMRDDGILEQSNPLALEIPSIMKDLKDNRERAIQMPSRRENFVTKHCNIIYQGIGTESYIDVADVKACRLENGEIDWTGLDVYIGVDLAETTDNCAVVMVAYVDGVVYCEPLAFIPEARTDEKSATERVDYRHFIKQMQCVACGDRVVDYAVIEEYVMKIEEQYGVKIIDIGYDRRNAMSSAQKWERAGYNVTEVEQHSRTLHAPTKLLKECILNHQFLYRANELYEINYQNAKCTEDTNKNKYVNKKRSAGKVDMVVATIIAVYIMQQHEIFDTGLDWGIQTA